MEENLNGTAKHYTGRIPLEGLPNTRDLGGIHTMDGKQIVPARLIRSGALYEATPADITRLGSAVWGRWWISEPPWREARSRTRR